MDAYLVKYESAGIPRNYEFFDLMQASFDNDSGNTTIDRDAWNEFLEQGTEAQRTKFNEKYKEEIEAVEKLLKENDNCIELNFG